MGYGSRKGNCTQAERSCGAHPPRFLPRRARVSVNQIQQFMKKTGDCGWLGSQLHHAMAKQGGQ